MHSAVSILGAAWMETLQPGASWRRLGRSDILPWKATTSQMTGKARRAEEMAGAWHFAS